MTVIDVDEPTCGPNEVLIKVEKGSVCGTDLHIFNWDPWAAGRIHPPRIIGHEFCGTIVGVGDEVTSHQVGDFVASESHIICGHCRQCRQGQGHVCINTHILGVDVDGGFRPLAAIPALNARPVPSAVPHRVACFMDALGNAVHTAMSGPIEGCRILITGMGPIGCFAAAICKVLGAEKAYATEVSPYRMELAEKMGVDVILNPTQDDVDSILSREEPLGVDATLEMSGHRSALDLAIRHTRPGGRISMLGVYPDKLDGVDFNQLIFKGIDTQGIVGRRLWQTWEQMSWLLDERGLDVTPVITHEFPFEHAEEAFGVLKQGRAGKIVFDFSSST